MSIKDDVKEMTNKKIIGKALRDSIVPLALILAVILLLCVVLASISNFITFWDGTVQEGKESNVPYLFKDYTEDTQIIGREIRSSANAEEIWNTVIKNNGRIKEYLDKPEELKKIMNAEIATTFLDTRENPDAPIDWEKLNSDTKTNVIQGLVKLKRARETGEYITMTYVDPETFQSYMDEYNASGSETAKNAALNHFTLGKGYTKDGIEDDSVGLENATLEDNTIGTDEITNEESNNTKVPIDYKDVGSADEKMCWPTNSIYILSLFGKREQPTEGASINHGGIDIGHVATGDNIYATESGVVVTAGYYGSAGLMVAIDHGNGYVTKYMHNSNLNVSVGDKVIKGQVIAFAGSTGVSTDTHLHFQIEYKGQKKDPLDFAYKNANGEDVTPTNTSSGTGSGGIGYNMDLALYNYETGNYPKGAEYGNETIEGKYYAKIAIWEETTETSATDGNIAGEPTTTYKMKTANVDYEKIVKGYTMPFEFIWAFLLVGQQKEFALELADLVFESTVEISVLDCIRTNTNVSTYTFTEHVEIFTDEIYTAVTAKNKKTNDVEYNKRFGPGRGKKEYDIRHEVTQTTKSMTNTIDVVLSRADVWLLDMQQGYVTQTNTAVSESDTPHSDVIYDPVTDNSDPAGIAADYERECVSPSDEPGDLESHAKQFDESKYTVSINTTQRSTYNRTDTDRNTYVSNQVYYLKNLATPASVEEKTDPDDTEPNFVNIFRKEEYQKNAENVFSAPEWIFQILEADESTADMVDITKYLLYLANDKVKKYDGVEEIDWETFWVSEYKTLEDGYGSPGEGSSAGGGYRKLIYAYSGIEGLQGEIYDYLLARGVWPNGVAAIVGNIEEQVKNGETTWEKVVEKLDSMWKQIKGDEELLDALKNARDEDSMEYAAWLFAKFQGNIIENNFETSKYKISKQLANARNWQTEFEEKNPFWVKGDGSPEALIEYCKLQLLFMNDNKAESGYYGLKYYDIEESSNYFVQKTQDCGGFTSGALFASGMVTLEEWNYLRESDKIAFHHPANLAGNLRAFGFELVPLSDLQPGDIVMDAGWTSQTHVCVYNGGSEYWDQNCKVVDGEPKPRTDFWYFVKNAVELRVYRKPEFNPDNR